jgi:hypothetical protein
VKENNSKSDGSENKKKRSVYEENNGSYVKVMKKNIEKVIWEKE